MRFLKLSLAAALTVSLPLFADEKEPAPAPDAKAAETFTPEQREYFEKVQRLHSLDTRISEDERQFSELVRAKNAAVADADKQRLIKDMVKTADDRNKAADEMNKVKTELTLRFPNQGEHLNRRYKTQSRKSVEELEGAAGLDELLTRTKKMIDKKFAPFKPKEKTEAKSAAPPAPEKTEKLRLEK